jgi:2-isopropylmalate synthase
VNAAPTSNSTDKVVIFDTTLRDGEQSPGVNFSKRDKLEIAAALAAINVDVIEAGFPAASAAELENVRAVAGAVRDRTICGLARCAERDIDLASDALSAAANPRIHLFVGTSAEHLEGQLRKTQAEVLSLVSAMVRRARNSVADVEFSAMDSTRADLDYLSSVVRTAIAAGATVINFPDTVGVALPTQVARRVRELIERVPELASVTVSFHGQNDLGLSTANSLAAIEAGARQVEVAVNGIGERAGNTALEEVVMALRLHGPALGVHTDVDSRGIYALSQLVRDRSGMSVQPNKAIVGANAFRHASGIHQDGVIKRRDTFEAIDPAWIGHPTGTELILGKLSGRAGFQARCRELGISLSPEVLADAFARFQTVADQQSTVSDAELRTIVSECSR